MSYFRLLSQNIARFLAVQSTTTVQVNREGFAHKLKSTLQTAITVAPDTGEHPDLNVAFDKGLWGLLNVPRTVAEDTLTDPNLRIKLTLGTKVTVRASL